MRHYVFFLLLVFAATASAQKFDVEFSDKIQSQSGILQGGIFLKSLGVPGEGVIALFVKVKKSVLGLGNNQQSYQILKFDRNLQIVKELEIDNLRLKNTAFIDLIDIKGNYYFITKDYNKDEKKLDIKAVKLDPVSLQMSEGITL